MQNNVFYKEEIILLDHLPILFLDIEYRPESLETLLFGCQFFIVCF